VGKNIHFFYANYHKQNQLIMTSINSMIFMIIKIDILMLIPLIDLMRYKLELWNSCSAGILPAGYVPHNTGKCCIHSFEINL